MKETALAEAHSFANAATYGKQVSSAYTNYKNYPVIYAQEKLSVINMNKKETGLDLSEQSNFIERNEGTSTTSNIGAITTATSIQPYQIYWDKGNSFMQTAFRSYKGENTYYNLVIPQGSVSAGYWVASRSVFTTSIYCGFVVRIVSSADVSGIIMCESGYSVGNGARTLFPVVTLSSELIKAGSDGDFSVEL